VDDISIIKFGGSSLDNTAKRIRIAANEIERLSRQTPIIVTVGGGEVLVTCQSKLRKQKRYEQQHYGLNSLTFHAMNFNCQLLRTLMASYRVEVIESGNKQEILASLSRGNLTIVPRINPETFLIAPKDLTPNQSDLTTVLMAEELKAKRVIFMKNLPGICSRDPNLREPNKKKFLYQDEPIDLAAEKKDINIFVYKRINPQQIIQVIHHDHCIEKSCIDFLNKTKFIKTIHFTGIKQPANLEILLDGKEAGSKLVVN
jgi:uridylate kinase